MWPFSIKGGIFEVIFEFREIKPPEAQGEFRGESLILFYASTLPTDTLPIIKKHLHKRWVILYSWHNIE